MKIKEIKIVNQDQSTEIANIGADAINVDYNDTTVKAELDKLNNNVDTNTTNISSEIATRANAITNLQSEIRGLASGSPKGSYANAAAIVSANPDTGVYIAQDNGHVYSWTKNGSNVIDLGIYQAAGFDDSKLISYIKYEEPYNLILYDKIVNGFINSSAGGISSSSTYYTTDFIPVQLNHTYRCVNRCRKCLFYDSAKHSIANSYMDDDNTWDYEYTATEDGFMRATFYKANGFDNMVVDITNVEDSFRLATNKWNKPFPNTNLSDTQRNEIISEIIKYDIEELTPREIKYHKYLQGNSGEAWQDNDNVNTKRFNCTRGSTYHIVTSLHGDGAGYCLTYVTDSGKTFFYKRSTPSLSDTYQLQEYTVTIPESFPKETGEILVTEWSALAGQTKVEESLEKDIASKAYVQSAIKDFVDTSIFEEYVNQMHASNILYGKKYVACGDSFTAGDFSSYVDPDGHSGTNSDAYDKTWHMYKTYPYWIAKRNGMTLINEAVNGSTMTNSDDGGSSRFSYQRYQNIPADADYITLKFGINDSASHQNMPIGTIDDTETSTFYGAWNTVLTWLITNRPNARIGILIGNGLSGNGHGVQDEAYCVAMRAIAKKFGIPYLDEDLDDNIPLTFRTNKDVDSTIKTLRYDQFKVSSTNSHPNIVCHKLQSEFIEAFLRRL